MSRPNLSRSRRLQSNAFAPRPLAAAVRSVVVAGLLLGSAAARAELPVAMGGLNTTSWVTQGAASAIQTATTLDINQTTDFAAYNWQSFNISADSAVNFNQPARSSIAFNRIFQGDPSQIFGALTSNGQVYLINSNGFVFGAGARVNVAGLVASALDVAEADVLAGIESAAAAGRPAFSAFANQRGDIEVQNGATITTADGGQVLLFAANVRNDGSLVAPDGQVVLAAGEKVYLTRPDDPNLRGFLVEVDADDVSDSALNDYLSGNGASLVSGKVTNTGAVTAAGGNVSLVGLAVNQQGRVNVTRAVNDGGSIRLVARDKVTIGANSALSTSRQGQVKVGGEATSGSVTLTAGTDSSSGGRVEIRAADVSVSAGPAAPVTITGAEVTIDAGRQLRVTASASDKVSISGQDVLVTAAAVDLDTGGASNADPAIAISGKSVVLSTLEFQRANASRTTLLRLESAAVQASFAAYSGGSGDLSIDSGVALTASNGGRVFALGPNVENRGSLTAQFDGQVLLAAGNAVYFGRPIDPDLRGYTVEVGNTGVTDGAITSLLARPENGDFRLVSGRSANFGTLAAEQGNITLAGLDVVQGGQALSSTSNSLNGSITLHARDTGTTTPALVSGGASTDLDGLYLTLADALRNVNPTRNGMLTLAAGSRSEIALDASTALALDVQAQRPSVVQATGRAIRAYRGSAIVAPGGDITLAASTVPVTPQFGLGGATGTSELYLADDVVIDASGADATVAASQYLVNVQLVGQQLRDTPLQRAGVLYSEKVWVDLRKSGYDDTNRLWYGTPLADLTGNYSGTGRDVRERNAAGGTIRLQSQGELVVDSGARLDVSGGTINYEGSTQSTSRLMKNGLVVDIANGNPLIQYDLVFDPNDPPALEQAFNQRWGVTASYGPSLLTQGFGRSSGTAGYVEGRDAGSVELIGQRVLFAGAIEGKTVAGPTQRARSDRAIDPAAARAGLLGAAPLSSDPTLQQVEAAEAQAAAASRRRTSDQLALAARLRVGQAEQPNRLGDQRNTYSDFVLASATSGSDLEARLGATAYDPATMNLATELSQAQLANLSGRPDLLAELPTSVSSYVLLSASALQAGAAGNVELYGNRQVVLAGPVSLPNGSLTTLSNRIDFAADLSGAGAVVSATAVQTSTSGAGAPSIVVHGGARLDVSGDWVNDLATLLAGGVVDDALLIDAGSLRLDAEPAGTIGGLVDVRAGSALRVEGGAWMDGESVFHAGSGGDITLIARPGSEAYAAGVRPLNLAGSLSGISFGSAGTLHLGAPSVCIGAACGSEAALLALDASLQPVVARLRSANPADRLANTLSFTDPGSLDALGFGRLELEATGGALLLTPGTTFAPVMRNRVLDAGGDGLATGTPLATVGRSAILPDYLREAVSVGLEVHTSPGTTEPDLARVRSDALVLASGSRLAVEAGGDIDLSANSRIEIAGEVLAPAGRINATLSIANDQVNLLNQSIWLTPTARLSVAGAVEYRPDITDGLLNSAPGSALSLGEVLDAGAVNLLAKVGFLVLQAGSVVDASAASAALGIIDARGQRQSALVYGEAGSIRLKAAEGLHAEGSLLAAAAPVEGSSGGTLEVTLDGNSRGQSTAETVDFGGASRVLTLTGGLPGTLPAGLAPGVAFPFSLSALGQGAIASETIAAGGFANLGLYARNLSNRNVTTAGRIDFAGNINLGLSTALVMEAAQFGSTGGSATLLAPYLALGRRPALESIGNPAVVPSADAGTGSLNLVAQLLDLRGNLAFDDFAHIRFASQGELRLSDSGTLRSGADLSLVAERITPSTLVDYTLQVTRSGGRIQTLDSGASGAGLPLSVGGAVTLKADHIDHGGSLVAPLGKLSLEASETLTTRPGSGLSVSAAGLVVPFGQTQFQLQSGWVYPTAGGGLFVFDASGRFGSFPEGKVSLSGNSVQLEGGSIDIGSVFVQGTGAQLPKAPTLTDPVTGETLVTGDVIAYEFFGGLGGSRDILDAAVRPGAFAVLPGLGATFSPYDAAIFGYGTLDFGVNQTITLAGGAGLAAGTYVKLPARYALVPGAFLVNPIADNTDFSGGTLTRPDGSALSSGYTGVAGTSFRTSRTGTFEIVSRATLDDRAEYRIASANNYFVGAKNSTLAATHKAIDANALEIQARDNLRLDAQLAARTAPGGLGSVVDIARTGGGGITVVAAGNSVSDGSLALVDAAVSALGADSLLIGGTRSTAGGTVNLAITSGSVTIAEGARLAGRDLIVAARDNVIVNAGSSIRAEGGLADARSYATTGDGALIRASGNSTESVTRTSTTGSTGNLDFQAGASIFATGSLQLDATGNNTLAGTLELPSGALNLAAGQINLGETDGISGLAGLTLNNAALARLNLDSLTLLSRAGIDFYGDTTLSADNLTLSAAALRGVNNAGKTVSLTGDRLVIRNVGAVAPASPVAGSGRFSADVAELSIGPGAVTLSGFDTVSLAASTRFSFSDIATLNVSQGDFSVLAASHSAAAGATLDVNVTAGSALLDDGAFVPAADRDLGGLGARLGVKARDDVTVGGLIELASGQVELTADTGNVTVADGGRIAVGGRLERFDNTLVGSPGGNVKLTATAGNVDVVAGGAVDVSAAAELGDAGRFEAYAGSGVVTLAGDVSGRAGAVGEGGEFIVDTGRSTDPVRYLAVASGGGFTDSFGLRLREGDFDIASGQTLTARTVAIALDGQGAGDDGNFTLAGTIDASGERGGKVTLDARHGISLVNGSLIDAHATAADGRGGKVKLGVVDSSGSLLLATGSRINVNAGADSSLGGEVKLRAERAVVATAGGANTRIAVDASIEGSERTLLEAFRVYSDGAGSLFADGVLSTADIPVNSTSTVYFTEAQSFMNGAAALESALLRSSDVAFDIIPGVELQRTGNLSLQADWSLHNWRFNGLPGVLTLRASGNLDIGAWNPAAGDAVAATGTAAGRLSDGFDGATNSAAPTIVSNRLVSTGFRSDESWSFSLTAGADLTAASPLAVNRAGTGDFRIQKGTVSPLATATGTAAPPTGNPTVTAPTTRMVRTGTGDLDIAAAGSVRLGNAASVIYTAGRQYAGTGTRTLTNTTNFLAANNRAQNPRLGGRAYPSAGGDLSIQAGGDIIGAQVRTGVSEWLHRTGGTGNSTASFDGPVGWTVAFDRFENGVGALGGGDVAIRAGGNLENLSVALPSIGVQVGSTTSFNDSRVEVIGGGDLSAEAGRDVLGGVYYIGRGEGTVTAGGEIDSNATAFATRGTSNENILHTIAVVDDATLSFTARRDLTLETVANSTLLPFSLSQWRYATANNAQMDSYFSTYGADAGVSLRSLAGNAGVDNNATVIDLEYDRFSSSGTGQAAVVLPMPPALSIQALSGSIALADVLTYPSARGTIELLAGGNITAATADLSGSLLQSDADPAEVAAFDATTGKVAPVVVFNDQNLPLGNNASTPTHDGDRNPNRIVARDGAIQAAVGQSYEYNLAKRTDFYSGQDLVGLDVQIQHNNSDDVSRITSGGGIRYDVSRIDRNVSQDGQIDFDAQATIGIQLHGPGRLEVAAAEDVDLGTSAGIDTLGNGIRSALPDGGADVYVLSGLNGQQPAYRNFLTWLGSSYPLLRSRSLVAVDPDSRLPITVPDGANITLTDRVEAADGEIGDLATLIIRDAAGVEQSRQTVRVIVDPVDLGSLYSDLDPTDTAAISARLLALAAGTDAEATAALLSASTRAMFTLFAQLGASQTPLENAVRQGVNGIRISATDPDLPQHPIAVLYEAVAQLFPRSGDQGLLIPLNEFAFGITTLDDVGDIAEKLGLALPEAAAQALIAANASRAVTAGEVDDTAGLSASDLAAEAQATALVNALRIQSVNKSVTRLLASESFDGTPIPGAATAIFPNALAGTQASDLINPDTYVAALQTRSFAASRAYSGDINLNFSRINTLDGGDIFLLAPGGGIEVGGAQAVDAKRPIELGLVARDGGSVSFFAAGPTNVNLSRIFATPNSRTARSESIFGLSTTNDIDAGRGSRTSVSSPDPSFAVDEFGIPRLVLGQPLSGAGIRSFDTGALDVFVTPVGVLDTNEAGIFSEGEVVPPPIVVGVAGISAGGASSSGGGAVAAPAAPDVAAAAVSEATKRTTEAAQNQVAENAAQDAAPALGILKVEVLSFFGPGAVEEAEEQ